MYGVNLASSKSNTGNGWCNPKPVFDWTFHKSLRRIISLYVSLYHEPEYWNRHIMLSLEIINGRISFRFDLWYVNFIVTSASGCKIKPIEEERGT